MLRFVFRLQCGIALLYCSLKNVGFKNPTYHKVFRLPEYSFGSLKTLFS
ncbi:hypothetical protein QDY71_07770 [Kingella negevensis]|nr:hypothetical protein [Kingella negevensis]MDK4680748.1 hypothetical protein [Kingella negevensis]MDK4681529.1 hypothetical protein [Kingella negevensis]MDK4683611.1 hypothetical protein [Kingella negevensis]MDK4691916.1 hypothetical protein [Kingella negevensis]MDK4692931.1 hypothetical protein [Kingella negevensis]